MKIKDSRSHSFSHTTQWLTSIIFLFVSILYIPAQSRAQGILNRKVSLTVKNKPVAEVLKEIEKKGNFYFSYNNNILKADSLVSVNAQQQSIAQLLDKLFDKKYQYQERDNHLIIHPALSAQYGYISGWIIDALTGDPVSYATVYERQQLVSTMTDEKGFFRLQLKEKRSEILLNISKVSYADTVVLLNAAQQSETRIGIQQISYALDSVVISGVERTWLAKRLLSTQQTMNSLNLSNFFSGQPFQFSLTPGLGSHGKMGAQVINRFSFNVFGGYTAGVNGFELGSLFNIVKQDVRFLQIAGLFNIVGGEVFGVQIGGLHNNVLKSVDGVQIAGLSNIVLQHADGVQVGGLYNQSRNMSGLQISGLCNINRYSIRGIQVGGLVNRNTHSHGIQIAGLANISTQSAKGIQVAGLANISMQDNDGMQIAGLLNKATTLKGVQIGVVNIADTLGGYAIGLVNIVRSGYHKLSVSTNEIQQCNLAYKSGNAGLYSIISAGLELDFSHKAFSIGYGLGRDQRIGRKLYLNPQLIHLFFYTGDWDAQNLVGRLDLNLKYEPVKGIMIYAGPSVSLLYNKAVAPTEGYRAGFAETYPSFSLGREVKGWIGWNMGVDLF